MRRLLLPDAEEALVFGRIDGNARVRIFFDVSLANKRPTSQILRGLEGELGVGPPGNCDAVAIRLGPMRREQNRARDREKVGRDQHGTGNGNFGGPTS